MSSEAELDMDPESEHVREVYARYGLAMYHASCLEYQIALCLSTRHDPLTVSKWRFDDDLMDQFEKTFGQLLSQLGTAIALPAEVERELETALRKRNWLAHHYWRERAVDLMTPRGREGMIAELSELTDQFLAVDSALSQHHHATLKRLGIPIDDPVWIQEQTSALLTEGDQWVRRGRRPEKTETLVACFRWSSASQTEVGPEVVMQADDGSFFMLCEAGLMRGPDEVLPEHLERNSDFDKALPAIVRTRLTVSEPWRWEMPLANGYYLWTRPVRHGGQFTYTWGLTRHPKCVDERVRKRYGDRG